MKIKKLNSLLKEVKILKRINNINHIVNELQIDSRKVNSNDIFFAIQGININGHEFIEEAILKGAIVIICENLPKTINYKITYIQVKNTSYTLGIIARNFYNNPSASFKLVAITGTNGKTSCTNLLYQLFCKLGFRCGLISTIENRIIDENISFNYCYTTPDILSLNRFFKKAKNKGCTYVFMEASSHGIDQNRLVGISICIAGFTNISHDHLDYHKTFSKYLKSKKILFDNLSKNSIAISNLDSSNGMIMIQNCRATKKLYSLKSSVHYKGKIIESRIDGLLLQFNGLEFWTPLIGSFNAYNLLLVFSIACELGINPVEVVTHLSDIKKVKGRFETFISDANIISIIDYAHTPDALKNILESINQVKTYNQRLFTIFGCGGNRDKKKRPKMGQIATEFSDFVIITSDNPRNEDPIKIIEDIKLGISIKNFNKYTIICNRKKAIKTAVLMAKINDIILIAGKGHENYQEINNIKYPFNDYEIIKDLFINKN